MAETKDDRHRYGQHYTPHEVARLLAAFAVRSTGAKIFDPSCGDGRFSNNRFRSNVTFPGRTEAGMFCWLKTFSA